MSRRGGGGKRALAQTQRRRGVNPRTDSLHYAPFELARARTSASRLLRIPAGEMFYRRNALGLRLRGADEFVGPLDEVLHVGGVGVASVVLTPGELSVEQALIDGRHLCGVVVA